MKKTFTRLAVVALPMLIASCGGDLFGGLDGGTDGGNTGTCPAGTTIFQIKNGAYAAVQGSASFVSDGCSTGIMASALEATRNIANDGQGNITLTSSDNSVIVGTGPVRCNSSNLSYGPITVSDGVCQFTANYSTQLTVTSDNAFTMTVSQTRTNPMKVGTTACNQPSTCTVTYRVSQKL